MQAAPYGAPQAYGAAPGGTYSQDLPGPLDDIARRLPQSAPGTLFGLPLSRLRDLAFQKKLLLVAGVALLVSIFVPVHVSPTIFVWTGPGKFGNVVWPILAGAVYLFLTVAPPNLRQNIPPAVQQWLPFGTSFIGILVTKAVAMGFVNIIVMSMMAAMTPAMLIAMAQAGHSPLEAATEGGGIWLFSIGYTVLVFGLLARLSQPRDMAARIVIGVGAAMLIPSFIDMIDLAFHFSHVPALVIIHNLLFFLVLLVAVACVVFLVPPGKVPALDAADALAPVITAALLLWLPFQAVLGLLIGLIHAKGGLGAFLGTVHVLLPIVAYFGVLMCTAPAAYDEAKRLFAGKGGAPPQGYPPYPPPGAGFSPPPPGGGFPPPGGGYPPPGGGYPPPGGGYPPPGGGYPPPGGGGYSPPGGGGPPPH